MVGAVEVTLAWLEVSAWLIVLLAERFPPPLSPLPAVIVLALRVSCTVLTLFGVAAVVTLVDVTESVNCVTPCADVEASGNLATSTNPVVS